MGFGSTFGNSDDLDYHPGHVPEDIKNKREIRKLKNELKAAKKIMWDNGKKLDEAINILTSLVGGIDNWNSCVEQIIGRQAAYNWKSLDEARKFIKENG